MKQESGSRRKRRLWEGIAVLAALLICGGAALFLYWPRQGKAVAVISVDGKEYRRIALSQAADQVFSIQADTGKPVSFEITDHKIRFVNVDCPDHVCEKAGWCKNPGNRAVCMPNRTALILYAPEEGALSPARSG